MALRVSQAAYTNKETWKFYKPCSFLGSRILFTRTLYSLFDDFLRKSTWSMWDFLLFRSEVGYFQHWLRGPIIIATISALWNVLKSRKFATHRRYLWLASLKSTATAFGTLSWDVSTVKPWHSSMKTHITVTVRTIITSSMELTMIIILLMLAALRAVIAALPKVSIPIASHRLSTMHTWSAHCIRIVMTVHLLLETTFSVHAFMTCHLPLLLAPSASWIIDMVAVLESLWLSTPMLTAVALCHSQTQRNHSCLYWV